MKLTRSSVAVAAICSFLAADAFAQLGSLRGKLVDEQGNGVADAECLIEISGGGGRSSTVKTKKSGEFVKGGLRPNVYTIVCEKEGFKKLPLQTQVSAFDQAYLGEHVFYALQPGELSESQHARATELLAEFNMASESGDHAGTIVKLKELQEMMPESVEVTFNLASTYEAMGDKDNAIAHYKKAAEANPDFAYDSWLAIADMHGKDKEWAEATESMGKAMGIKAIDPVAMFNYAVYAQNAGDTDTAQSAYEKTLQIDPARAIAYYQLGLIAVNQEDDEKAIAHFEQFLSLAPDDPQAEAARGVVEALKQKGNQ